MTQKTLAAEEGENVRDFGVELPMEKGP